MARAMGGPASVHASGQGTNSAAGLATLPTQFSSLGHTCEGGLGSQPWVGHVNEGCRRRFNSLFDSQGPQETTNLPLCDGKNKPRASCMVSQKPVLDSKRSRPWPASHKGPRRGLGADFTSSPVLSLPTIHNSGLQYWLTMRLFQFWFLVTMDTPVAYHMDDVHNKRPLICTELPRIVDRLSARGGHLNKAGWLMQSDLTLDPSPRP